MSHSSGSGSTLQLGEALAAILRHQQRADLDADQQAVTVDDDVLDVADARRRREAPFRHARRPAQRRQLAPALAGILADIEMRGQRPDTDHIVALQPAGARGPEVEMVHALVGPGPGDAAVAAAGDADAVGGGEQRAVVERRDRADEAAGERTVCDGPALRRAIEHGDAVDRADDDAVGGSSATAAIAAAVREQDHRRLLAAIFEPACILPVRSSDRNRPLPDQFVDRLVRQL